ncbi:MAG: hypothetical protein LBV16_00690 [Elusimicrobiota bacterium]|jgi:hypothetical protein|nr:hypothetical protein [Elusimicrobiota bacterium]
MKKFNEYKPWQLKGVLEMLVPLVIGEISKSRNISHDEAIELLYSSHLYKTLETESTKMWHLSQLTLSDLLNEELETGKITFPEEA